MTPTANSPVTTTATLVDAATITANSPVIAALTRFRVSSYIVGVALLALMLLAVPLKRLAGIPEPVMIVSPIHGFMYMVYVALTFDLGRRANWNVKRILGMMLAGTIPFLSFYAERRASAWVKGS